MRPNGPWGEHVVISLDLLINALVAGLLLGAFYAAVTVGISISFGILDIVNIAHPGFIILGSYIAYIVNTRLGIDPILVSIVMLPVFYALGAAVYQVYYVSFEKRGREALSGLAFFFGLLFVTEVMLIIVFGVDYRYVEASYIGPTLRFGFVDLPLRMLVPCLVALALFARAAAVPDAHLHRPRDHGGGAGSAGAAADGRLADPHQAHRLRHLDRDLLGGRRAAHHHPADRALGRARIYRPRVRDLRARRARQPARHADRRDPARRDGEPHRELLRPLLGAGRRLRLPAAHPRVPADGSVRTLGRPTVRTWVFFLICVAVGAAVFAAARMVQNDYVFFAGYVVLQFIVLATAWNILGGYTGYVNFGSAAFFAAGAYTSVFFHKFYPLPIPVLIVLGAIVSGLIGLGMGYLTLRLRGAFFAIATLALAVVLQTLIVNWNYVGGARGAYVIRPESSRRSSATTSHYLFVLMLALAIIAITIARAIERSQLGYGFATIRDDELAAEASGVPTLKLKLDRHHAVGRVHGHGRRAVPLLHRLSAAGLRLRARLRGQLDRHADDRRHHLVGRPADRRHPGGDPAAMGDGDDLVGAQPADRRAAAGGFVIIAPNGIVGLVQEPARGGRSDGRAAAPGQRSEQALRRLRRARRHRSRGRRRASGSA